MWLLQNQNICIRRSFYKIKIMKNQGNNIRLPLSFIPIFFSLFNRQWNTFFQHNDQRSKENFFGSDLEEADLSHGGGGDEEGSGRGWFVVIMRGGGEGGGGTTPIFSMHSLILRGLSLSLGQKKIDIGKGASTRWIRWRNHTSTSTLPPHSHVLWHD